MKPFLKWAGSKYRIVDHIKTFLPEGKRLIEPFVGSGAVFLNTDYPEYLLTDSNSDLISLYRHLKNEGPSFITYCEKYFAQKCNDEEKFYELRNDFNSTKDERLKAALFVYLNRHCYNGLCRYNSKGGFNVPFGRYKKTYFPRREMIAFHEKAQRASFKVADFRDAMMQAKTGDVVYCDPPYVPISETSNFTTYAAGGFNLAAQEDLAEYAKKLAKRGITVVISNHDTEFSRKIYKGAKFDRFDVQRFISCDGKNRTTAPELLAIFTRQPHTQSRLDKIAAQA